MLEKVNNIAGRDVEITVRGEREFTFSFFGIDRKSTKALCDFFRNSAAVNVSVDAELGTFVYCDFF